MTVHTIPIGDLGKFEKKFAQSLRLEVQSGLRAAAREVKQVLEQRSSRIRDRGIYQKSWKVEAKFTRLDIDNVADHSPYVEGGRRPGARMPPLQPIREWLERHGSDPAGAFIVARAIGLRGIQPRPVLTWAKPQIDKIVMGHVTAAHAKAIFKAGVEIGSNFLRSAIGGIFG
jgi:hypothetical protein